MKPEHYKGREQTYLKHFFLEKYLETVAFHILSGQVEFTYVDCFSGPWKYANEDLADTSIRISLDKLNYVLSAQKAPRTIRAIFIEKDPAAFAALQQTIGQHHGSLKTVTIPGEFEDNIPRILEEIAKGFAFFFVDPTGWSVTMERLKPLLRHKRGEVMINFMYDFINRAINSEDPATEASLDRFFGISTWRALRAAAEREMAIVNFYAERIRKTGDFSCVTSTATWKNSLCSNKKRFGASRNVNIVNNRAVRTNSRSKIPGRCPRPWRTSAGCRCWQPEHAFSSFSDVGIGGTRIYSLNSCNCGSFGGLI